MSKKQILSSFKKSVKNWVNFFGLHYFRVKVIEEYCEECFAYIVTDCQHATARIYVSIDSFLELEEEEIKVQIDKTAFHEVCHLFLSRISTAARTRFLNPDQLEEAEEMVIRTLENCVY